MLWHKEYWFNFKTLKIHLTRLSLQIIIFPCPANGRNVGSRETADMDNNDEQ